MRRAAVVWSNVAGGDGEAPLLAPPGYRAGWLLYAHRPRGPLPRRWRGLVGYGRLDIAARFMLAALYPGGLLLGDSFMLLFLDEGGGEGEALLFEPDCLPGEMHEEEEAARLLLDALRGGRCRRGPASLRGLLLSARRGGYRVVALREGGGEPRAGDGGYLFLVGSRVDPPTNVPVDEVWGLGCFPYLASTVAAYINLVRVLAAERGRDEG